MSIKIALAALGLSVVSTASYAQVLYSPAQPVVPGYVDGRSAFVPNAQNNGDPSAPASGGGFETRESSTYGGTQIPGHD